MSENSANSCGMSGVEIAESGTTTHGPSTLTFHGALMKKTASKAIVTSLQYDNRAKLGRPGIRAFQTPSKGSFQMKMVLRR